MTEFQITEKRSVGDGHPVFIIAEIGNNHSGDFQLAMQAISHAHEAKADAVSFQYAPLQSYCIKTMYSDPAVSFLPECEFSLDELQKLQTYAKDLGLAFSINVEDQVNLDNVLLIGIDFIKLCSADLTNLPFLRYCARQGKPIFFSTGGAYLHEIETAHSTILAEGLTDYVLYHTNSGYPTPLHEANLAQMTMLHDKLGGVKGYCDHTCEIIPPIVAAAMGAKVIEKHITTDRNLKGDDWMVSLEPCEFKFMVESIRKAELSIGTSEKIPLPSEEKTRIFKRKSIVSKRPLKKGDVICYESLCFKVPGTGISPERIEDVIGKTVISEIPEDTLITFEQLS